MQVKGMAFNARMDFVKQRFGDAKLGEVLDSVPYVKELAAASDGFYPSRLYNFRDYTAFNQAICDTLYGGKESAYLDMGEFSADVALKTVHKVFVMNKDVRSFIRSLPIIYNAYFSGIGAAHAWMSERENLARVHISGVRNPHRSLCQVVIGYMRHGMELCGANGVQCIETSCMCRGGDSCETEVRWR